MAVESRTKLARLACGAIVPSTQGLCGTLGHLANTLDQLVEELPAPYGGRPDARPLFLPFLVRGILEVTCTALIARTDPFRVLALRAIQSSSSYDATRRVGCAIQWQGDVVYERAAVWDADMKPEKLARALLGDHQDQVLWRPAFERFLDALAGTATVGRWTSELQGIAPDGFVPRLRNHAQVTYSTASKGIHHEYLLPMAAYTDESSVKDMIETGVKTAAALSVVANFCEHVAFPIPHVEALAIYEALQ